jgi:hypothetical protein
MEKIYLLKKDKIMLGPYSVEKLKEKNLKASDLIWYEGLPDWTPAGNLISLDTSDPKTDPLPTQKLSLKGLLKKFFSFGK